MNIPNKNPEPHQEEIDEIKSRIVLRNSENEKDRQAICNLAKYQPGYRGKAQRSSGSEWEPIEVAMVRVDHQNQPYYMVRATGPNSDRIPFPPAQIDK